MRCTVNRGQYSGGGRDDEFFFFLSVITSLLTTFITVTYQTNNFYKKISNSFRFVPTLEITSQLSAVVQYFLSEFGLFYPFFFFFFLSIVNATIRVLDNIGLIRNDKRFLNTRVRLRNCRAVQSKIVSHVIN